MAAREEQCHLRSRSPGAWGRLLLLYRGSSHRRHHFHPRRRRAPCQPGRTSLTTPRQWHPVGFTASNTALCPGVHSGLEMLEKQPEFLVPCTIGAFPSWCKTPSSLLTGLQHPHTSSKVLLSPLGGDFVVYIFFISFLIHAIALQSGHCTRIQSVKQLLPPSC